MESKIESARVGVILSWRRKLTRRASRRTTTENEMPSPTSQVPIVEGSIAAKILNTMVKHASSKPARRPWRGPLPPPRVSPKRTLRDAIEAAMVCPGSSSRSWISGSSPTASTGRSRRSPETAQVNNSRSLFFGYGNSRKYSKLKIIRFWGLVLAHLIWIFLSKHAQKEWAVRF